LRTPLLREYLKEHLYREYSTTRKKELMVNKKYKNGEKEEGGGAVCVLCAKNYAKYLRKVV